MNGEESKLTPHSCQCQAVNKRFQCSANLMVLVIAVSCGQMWIINSWRVPLTCLHPPHSKCLLPMNQSSSNTVCIHCPEKFLSPPNLFPSPIQLLELDIIIWLMPYLFIVNPELFFYEHQHTLVKRCLFISFLDSMEENCCLIASIFFLQALEVNTNILHPSPPPPMTPKWTWTSGVLLVMLSQILMDLNRDT